VFAFGGPEEVIEMDLPLNRAGIERATAFLGQSFRGGTDICAPLEKVIATVEQEGWRQADLLLATDGEFGATPADVVAALRNEGIEARHGFKPMHQQPVFAGSPVVGGAVADDLFATTVSLPSGSRLTDADVEWICGVVASVSR